MAGGQERILRQRIRSINATKKITRAFELIAASRIVRAQQRVHAAQPYSDQITEVVKDLAAAGGEVQSPLLAARPEIRRACHIVIAADRGLCGAYNSSVIRAAEGEIKNDALARHRVLARAHRAQGRELLPLPRLRHRRGVHRLHRDAHLRRRPRHRPARRRHVPPGRGRHGGARLHAVRVGRLPRGGAAAARAARARDPGRWRRQARHRRRPQRRLRVRAVARRHPRGAPSPLRRGPDLRRPPQRGRLAAGRPPARHEGGHRQRRRAHQELHAHHEPRPSGLHHHRDHGDRRRRRGLCPPARTMPTTTSPRPNTSRPMECLHYDRDRIQPEAQGWAHRRHRRTGGGRRVPARRHP